MLLLRQGLHNGQRPVPPRENPRQQEGLPLRDMPQSLQHLLRPAQTQNLRPPGQIRVEVRVHVLPEKVPVKDEPRHPREDPHGREELRLPPVREEVHQQVRVDEAHRNPLERYRFQV